MEPENRYSKAGKARVRKLSPRQRSEIARKGAKAKWRKAGIDAGNCENTWDVLDTRERAVADAESEALAELLDPVRWIHANIVNPDTGRPFELYPEQEAFLREALTPDPQTLKLKYSEIIFGAPKKSGKTATAAIVAIYVIVCLSGGNAEGYVGSNSREQAGDRVFTDIGRILKASPKLQDQANVLTDSIEFPDIGSFIKTVTGQAASAAGPRPTIVIFDELWGFIDKNSERLWDEMVPTPTTPISIRLTVTYAGFVGESNLLEGLYGQIFQADGTLAEGVIQVGTDLYAKGPMLVYWTHELRAPWQTQEWVEKMRVAYAKRPNQFERIIRNRWVSAESTFIEPQAYDRCVDKKLRPERYCPHLKIWLAVDASVRKDSTALVGVALDPLEEQESSTWLSELRDRPIIRNPLLEIAAALPWAEDFVREEKAFTAETLRLKVVLHRIYEARAGGSIDFARLERELVALTRAFNVQSIAYDPYQMVSLAQGLSASGIPMLEMAQTASNTTGFSQLLYDLISQQRLRTYSADDLRLHVVNAVAKESTTGGRQGWHIVKRTRATKIDAAVSLAMACFAASKALTDDSTENDSGIDSPFG